MANYGQNWKKEITKGVPTSDFSTFILLKVDLGPTPKKVLETQFYYYYNKENGLFRGQPP